MWGGRRGALGGRAGGGGGACLGGIGRRTALGSSASGV